MLIGITGYARHGKDTTADVLVRQFGYTKYSFAGKMKQCLKIIFGWSDEYIANSKDIVDHKWGISPRKVLQLFGTEFGQHMLSNASPEFKRITGRKLWVKALLNSIERKSTAVIADLRYPHEADEVRASGGVIIRVEGSYAGCPTVGREHSSEMDIDLITPDYTIVNSGTLMEYQNYVKDWFGWIKEKRGI